MSNKTKRLVKISLTNVTATSLRESAGSVAALAMEQRATVSLPLALPGDAHDAVTHLCAIATARFGDAGDAFLAGTRSGSIVVLSAASGSRLCRISAPHIIKQLEYSAAAEAIVSIESQAVSPPPPVLPPLLLHEMRETFPAPIRLPRPLAGARRAGNLPVLVGEARPPGAAPGL